MGTEREGKKRYMEVIDSSGSRLLGLIRARVSKLEPGELVEEGKRNGYILNGSGRKV